MKTTRILFICFACGLGLATAEEITLAPTKDNTIFEDSGNLSNGQGVFLFSGATANRNAQLVRRALLSFDIVGNLPAGATITEASLEMTVNKVPSGQVTNDFGLHRLLKDWGEGTSDAGGNEGRGATASAGDATWDDTMTGTSWDTPGGDFVEAASALTSIAGNGRYTWASTDQLVTDVQSWLNQPDSNFGWIVIGDESVGRTAKRFASVQSSSDRVWPALNITFEIGAQLVGDYDLDGVLTPADIDLLCGAINGGENPSGFDVNGDGAVDIADLSSWVEDQAGTFVGDADLNGTVAFGDFLALSAGFGGEGTWINGDFDCNGLIQFPDFLALSSNFGKTSQTLATVPEPSGMFLLLSAILFARTRRPNKMR
jgi:hypothetical protein